MTTAVLYTQYAFFFFNDSSPTEIYTLSLHDALPISGAAERDEAMARVAVATLQLAPHRPGDVVHRHVGIAVDPDANVVRSEEHTSELQSQSNLVCRLLLEKKNLDTYVKKESDLGLTVRV